MRLVTILIILLVTIQELLSCNFKKNTSILNSNAHFDTAKLKTSIKVALKEDSAQLYTFDFSNDTLEIVSNFEWSFYPFGIDTLSIDRLQKINNSIFLVSSTKRSDNSFIHKLTYEKSFIKLIEFSDSSINQGFEKLAEHNYSKPPKFQFVSAQISNDKIKTALNLQVGITKESFFKKVFNYYDNNLANVRIFINEDVLGTEYVQVFVFNGNVLNKILIYNPLTSLSYEFE